MMDGLISIFLRCGTYCGLCFFLLFSLGLAHPDGLGVDELQDPDARGLPDRLLDHSRILLLEEHYRRVVVCSSKFKIWIKIF